ncbi:NfeD family protein [Microbaculum marinisediminis]|uniref:NfeD family protein n=1 Tax=Microbaculum marinisediminis TaxID=2931392 RepID=UPI003CC5D79E
MIELIASLGYWNWWILGIVLLCVELVAPGTFMLWFGAAALVVGLLSLLIDWSWQAQFVTFGVLSIASVGLSRFFLRRKPSEGEAPFLNRRAEAIVGRGFVLTEPIVNGRGRLSIDDTVWRIEGPDLPTGTPVTVSAARGSRLVVRQSDAP